jgi:pyruvate/2-oxoglutarate dehydrogenase complex dihydrolipoamide acyltransferase (E2) component
MSKVVPIRMPKLTMAAVDGRFLTWLSANGESVAAEQPIYTVETDKAQSDIPSPAAGVLRHGKAETEVVYPVGAMLGAIEIPD